tara:strand:- start:261 stop:2054 length:1794 start_codon:yes stop_codon:yes gene_type:complete
MVLFSSASFAQETLNFKKYTLSEFFQLIENEPSDSFVLKNANIVLDTIADMTYLMKKNDLTNYDPIRKDSIHIHKSILLENVFMQELYAGDKFMIALNKVIFHKPVTIINSSLNLLNNHFLNSVTLRTTSDFNNISTQNFNKVKYGILRFSNSIFELDPRISSSQINTDTSSLTLWMDTCTFKGSNNTADIRWFLGGLDAFTLKDNTFLNKATSFISMYGNLRGQINNNNFGNRFINFFIADEGVTSLNIYNNKFAKKTLLSLPESIQNIKVDWNQFSSGIVNGDSYNRFTFYSNNSKTIEELDAISNSDDNMNIYLDSVRIADRSSYKSEIALLGNLNAIYKRQHDMESANASYITLKNLETQRLEYLYKKQPSFDTYFEWKVNQFLKLFSDYGTRPAKAITFSVYVILCFALIYLFFPNHWDSHGKNRLMDRFRFFTKYMNRDAGLHDVYLEEQKNELLASEDFKKYMQKSEKHIPTFFMATAIPLYKWSVSGTKMSASFLKRIDIMKGTWSDLPQSKRIWKSILLISAFTIAICYDIFIKMLNALMLSINTFTTLGFGEIPIKGLPRYLAIIQGFIGWFMLTIFSVSLISQLLN